MKENERKESAFPECSLFPKEFGEPLRAALLFPHARSKLLQNVHYSLERRGAAQGTPASDRRGDREGTARDLNLEKRDKYL